MKRDSFKFESKEIDMISGDEKEKIKVETNVSQIDDIVKTFRDFLVACGYSANKVEERLHFPKDNETKVDISRLPEGKL